MADKQKVRMIPPPDMPNPRIGSTKVGPDGYEFDAEKVESFEAKGWRKVGEPLDLDDVDDGAESEE